MSERYHQPIKYYIASSYKQFREYGTDNKLQLHDMQFIKSGDKSKIMGLRLTPDNVEIINDPKAPFSFWQYLLAVCLRN